MTKAFLVHNDGNMFPVKARVVCFFGDVRVHFGDFYVVLTVGQAAKLAKFLDEASSMASDYNSNSIGT